MVGSLHADSQPKLVGLVWGLTATWHSACILRNEPTELSQWPCHNDSTINIGIGIIIFIIYYYKRTAKTYVVIVN